MDLKTLMCGGLFVDLEVCFYSKFQIFQTDIWASCLFLYLVLKPHFQLISIISISSSSNKNNKNNNEIIIGYHLRVKSDFRWLWSFQRWSCRMAVARCDLNDGRCLCDVFCIVSIFHVQTNQTKYIWSPHPLLLYSHISESSQTFLEAETSCGCLCRCRPLCCLPVNFRVTC